MSTQAPQFVAATCAPSTSRSIGKAFSVSAASVPLTRCVEEVVGRRGDHQLRPPRLGHGGDDQRECRRGCGGWGRRSPPAAGSRSTRDRLSRSSAHHLRVGHRLHQRLQRSVGDHLARRLGRVPCGPKSVSKSAPSLLGSAGTSTPLGRSACGTGSRGSAPAAMTERAAPRSTASPILASWRNWVDAQLVDRLGHPRRTSLVRAIGSLTGRRRPAAPARGGG